MCINMECSSFDIENETCDYLIGYYVCIWKKHRKKWNSVLLSYLTLIYLHSSRLIYRNPVLYIEDTVQTNSIEIEVNPQLQYKII